MTTDLADRYGTAPGWRRPVAMSLAAVLAVVGLGWLGWTMWFHATPAVRSELVSFQVTSDHETEARLDVRVGGGVDATCRLRAFAEDHTPVGELAFTPTNGTNEVVIRTERRATTVEKLGCTSDGQPRPR
ncbi:DUF4307 domain-containing protein [Nocardioides KLBMP 9356]|uniref:DUF4307 domain-containing protein n=1 Tax=Nocardioides potassii TaxID=2911371 RepID=A0ABS9H904_9ACTN|nr:DUF4307 domain-containing protein [Nocardioides potassii]MCF6376581.1 DUF4307 domain-containing protein [Nocardioides potassii]